MNIAIGFLMAAVMGFWVYADARAREASRPVLWGIGTFLLAIVFLPAWLIARPRRLAVRPSGPRRCPCCADPIQPSAVACMHCGRDVPPDPAWPEAHGH